MPADARSAPAGRLLLATSGGAGDVAPYTGLGVRLRQAGYDVTIATHEPFAGMIRTCGLGFHPLPGDPRAFLHGPAGDSQAEGRSTGWSAAIRAMEEHNQRTGEAILAAAEPGTDLLLLAVGSAQLGYVVAEALEVPSLGVFLQPTEPTREFASVLAPLSLGRWGNRASARVAGAVASASNAKAAKHLRAELGLAPSSLGAQRHRQRDGRWPICCGVSPQVLPRPHDWREGVDMVGYWWPALAEGWAPSPELTAFLEAGPPPVYVGFGSLGGDPERLAEIIPRALRRAGARGVIQAGWGELAAGPDAHDDIITIGEAPHEWLFPRMGAVVHAAGSGVVGAGLRANVPAVPVPVGFDQPFWGRRLVQLGVSPDSIPFKKLSVERLATAIRRVLTIPAYRERASGLGKLIRDEDGAGRTLEAVRRRLT